MKNFKVTSKEDNREYWISRSCAVVGVLFVPTSEGPKFLISKRGENCPDFVGSWSFPCGYLDYDETLEQAVAREVYEELGLSGLTFEMFQIDSTPSHDSRQNVIIHYIAGVDEGIVTDLISTKSYLDSLSRGGEPGEVSDVALIGVDSVNSYDWAFNHGELLRSIAQQLQSWS